MNGTATEASMQVLDDQIGHIRDRLGQTDPDQRALRVMLVLTHEVLRLRKLADGGRWMDAPPAIAATASAIDYGSLVESVRTTVMRMIPPGSHVLVISRGDDALMASGYTASHFPSSSSGGYAGHYPADGRSATDHLDACRQAGAEFLVIPSTAYWWLDYYDGFAQHLLACGRIVHHDTDCLVAQLNPLAEGDAA